MQQYFFDLYAAELFGPFAPKIEKILQYINFYGSNIVHMTHIFNFFITKIKIAHKKNRIQYYF